MFWKAQVNVAHSLTAHQCSLAIIESAAKSELKLCRAEPVVKGGRWGPAATTAKIISSSSTNLISARIQHGGCRTRGKTKQVMMDRWWRPRLFWTHYPIICCYCCCCCCAPTQTQMRHSKCQSYDILNVPFKGESQLNLSQGCSVWLLILAADSCWVSRFICLKDEVKDSEVVREHGELKKELLFNFLKMYIFISRKASSRIHTYVRCYTYKCVTCYALV